MDLATINFFGSILRDARCSARRMTRRPAIRRWFEVFVHRSVYLVRKIDPDRTHEMAPYSWIIKFQQRHLFRVVSSISCRFLFPITLAIIS